MSRAQGSPLLNCTWREIPLNSSWQTQWAGRQIKQVTEQKPYKYITFTCLTSNGFSSAQPLRSSCKSTNLSCIQQISEEDTVPILSAIFCFALLHITSCIIPHPTLLITPETGLFLTSHCRSFRSFGFFHIHLGCPIRHQMTEAAPERGQEAT